MSKLVGDYPTIAEATGGAGAIRAWLRRAAARVQSARRDPHASRGRRVVLLLLLLWIANGFDLAFTLLASRAGGFVEANPLAAGLLGNPAGLVAYKAALVGMASIVLLLFRTRRLTEVCCWGLCVAYVGLAGLWWTYYFARGGTAG